MHMHVVFGVGMSTEHLTYVGEPNVEDRRYCIANETALIAWNTGTCHELGGKGFDNVVFYMMCSYTKLFLNLISSLLTFELALKTRLGWCGVFAIFDHRITTATKASSTFQRI